MERWADPWRTTAISRIRRAQRTNERLKRLLLERGGEPIEASVDTVRFIVKRSLRLAFHPRVNANDVLLTTKLAYKWPSLISWLSL